MYGSNFSPFLDDDRDEVQDVCTFMEKAPRRMRRVIRGTRFIETDEDDAAASSKRLVMTRTPVGRVEQKDRSRLVGSARQELAERVKAAAENPLGRLFAV